MWNWIRHCLTYGHTCVYIQTKLLFQKYVFMLPDNETFPEDSGLYENQQLYFVKAWVKNQDYYQIHNK